MSIEQSTDGKIVALNVYLPERVLKAFKIKCIKEGKSIKSVIIDFCKDYAEDEIVRENETDSGKAKEKED